MPPIAPLFRWTRLATIALIGLLVNLGFTGSMMAQDYDRAGFRSLGSRQIPTPNQLLAKLGQLRELDLPQSNAQQLRELGEKILSNMSPEDRENFKSMAEQLLQNQQGELPPQLSELAESFREQARRQGKDFEFRDLLKQLPDNFPTPGNNVDPGSGATTYPPFRNLPQGQTTPPETVSPPANNNPPVTDPGVTSGGSVGGSTGNNPTELPGTGDLEQLAEQFEESISEMPETRRFDPGEGFAENNQPLRPRGNESAGNRIDRIIMDAVENRLSNSGEAQSRIAESVNSAFSGLMEGINNRMKQRDWSSSVSERSRGIGHRIQEQMNHRPAARGNRSWFGSGWGGSGSGGLSGSGDFLTRVLPILGAFLLLGGLGWFALRYASMEDKSVRQLLFGGRFRLPKINSAEQLVRAVDAFLLARFGKPSSWWHSRRAEVALNADIPGKTENIRELVDCYEYARYSEVGRLLSKEQIQRCTSILLDLSSTRTSDDPEATQDGGLHE